jgi:hypothetical protein
MIILAFGVILTGTITTLYVLLKQRDKAEAEYRAITTAATTAAINELHRRLGVSERNIVRIYRKVKHMATEQDLDNAVAKLNTAVAANDARIAALENAPNVISDAAVAAINAAADHLNPPAPATDAPVDAPANTA